MVTHPANYGEFDFKGPEWFRRLNYFLAPGVKGKANPIYSIFVKNSITPFQLSALSEYRYASDIFFLYRYLNSYVIRTDTRVKLKKRIHLSNAGGGVRQQLRRSIMIKLIGVIKSVVTGPMIGSSLNKSCFVERIFITLLYPVAGFRILLTDLAIQLSKFRHNRVGQTISFTNPVSGFSSLASGALSRLRRLLIQFNRKPPRLRTAL